MKLAANLDWLYGHQPLEQRFESAAKDGFDAVEILQPYDQSPGWYEQALRCHGLQAALINTQLGQGAHRLGFGAVPGAEESFRDVFLKALDVAATLRCPSIHVMVGIASENGSGAGTDTLLGNLEKVLPIAEDNRIQLLLEPLNQIDAPGYFYARPAQALKIIRHFDSRWLGLQFDFYHCLRENLDVLAEAENALGWVRHIQIGNAPDRDEPDLSRSGLLEALGALHGSGYTGWIGCEYRPRTTALEGLAWSEPLRTRGWLR